jgi:hypothetical protein
MAMFEEKKVESSGIWEQKKLDKLTPNKGDSIGFYLKDHPMFTGDDGDFMVCQGLMVDLSAKDVDTMVAEAQPISFAARSILEGQINEGAWHKGQVARLEMNIRRGDMYKGKKVKYYAWNLFILNVPNDVINQLDAKITELEGKKPSNMTETPAGDSKSKEKPKLD